MTQHHYVRTGLFAATILAAVSTSALAQDGRRGWGPGALMGPGMMNARGFAALCSPQAAGLAEWQLGRIERSVKPNDEQKKKLADLRAASSKAADTIQGACPRELPRTSSERLAVVEKRIDAFLQAVKTVRPAFDDFYNSLSAEQKSKLDGTGPRRWGWQFWRRNDR